MSAPNQEIYLLMFYKYKAFIVESDIGYISVVVIVVVVKGWFESSSCWVGIILCRVGIPLICNKAVLI